MNAAQTLYLQLGVNPFTLTRHGLGKSLSARKKGPGRIYEWGATERVSGEPPAGTRRFRVGPGQREHDAKVREDLHIRAFVARIKCEAALLPS